MCKLKSGIILKNRIFVPEYDSHQRMLDELGIEDNYLNASKTFVRFELSPKNGDVFSDVEKWKLTIDQDILPEWYSEKEYKPQIVEAIKKWTKAYVHSGVNSLTIVSGERHYIKNCKAVNVYNSAIVNAYGNSDVRALNISRIIAWDDSFVEAFESSFVEAHDNATVTAWSNSTIIANDVSTVIAYENSIVEAFYHSTVTSYNSSFVTAYNNSTITAWDNSTVTVNNDSTVKANDFSTIIKPTHSSFSKLKLTLSGHSTFKDCITKTIHQAGDWKFIEEQVKHKGG